MTASLLFDTTRFTMIRQSDGSIEIALRAPTDGPVA
jgi:hypothetical protein